MYNIRDRITAVLRAVIGTPSKAGTRTQERVQTNRFLASCTVGVNSEHSARVPQLGRPKTRPYRPFHATHTPDKDPGFQRRSASVSRLQVQHAKA